MNSRPYTIRPVLVTASVMCASVGIQNVAHAQEEEPVTLRVQTFIDCLTKTPQPRDAPFCEAHDAYIAQNPHVNVEFELVPAFDLYKQFLIAAMGGNPPDITWQGAANTYTLALSGHVRPFNEMIEGHSYLSPENLAGPVFEQATVEGQHYGIPAWTDARLIYYRKDLFEEAGLDPENPARTRAELVSNAKALTKDTNGDGVADQWGFCFVADNTQMTPHFWLTHVYSDNGNLVDEDGNAVYAGEAGVEAGQLYYDLVNTYEVSPPAVVATNYDETLRALIGGTCAMAMLGSWSWSIDLVGALGEERVGWTEIPPTEDGESGTFGGGWSWMIAAESSHPKEAWEWIEAVSTDEVSLELAEVGTIPTRQSVMNSPELADTFVGRVAEYSATAGHGNPKVRDSQPLLDGLRQALQEIIQGQKEPAAALREAADAYNRRYANP